MEGKTYFLITIGSLSSCLSSVSGFPAGDSTFEISVILSLLLPIIVFFIIPIKNKEKGPHKYIIGEIIEKMLFFYLVTFQFYGLFALSELIDLDYPSISILFWLIFWQCLAGLVVLVLRCVFRNLFSSSCGISAEAGHRSGSDS